MEKKQVLGMLGVIIAITAGIVLYCLFFGNQYTVTFDSNGGSKVEKQVLKVGKQVKEPKSPTREGYEFIEWQLKGKKYDFDSKVKQNITLIAKWKKISETTDLFFTVKFNSDGGSNIDEQTIVTGGKASKPKNPDKDGYTFEGWYANDSLYDFDKSVTSDMELMAKWQKKSSGNNGGSGLSSDLKVGDRVLIVGSYAESSTSTQALHSKAKGWKRVILKIYEGREYPYRVGDSTGTTGFFKAESLEKID